ncbi:MULTISPECIES: MFS transporter [unclassified Paenibacillus]|uniref:MFS transporter n=1 Tax=unclassified Paenibacillus TaxID=185978 RepID=UPI0024060185|nr:MULTISPECIES: MFS transporter [unclassified Paenibacillus]MDF9842950.1 ACDE family multidrug resistance protein [Paenibacillus sp. PastF-2]MDF9849538.1 ACDE family multidrug resistance protein [Paenibacillus sp. PastM-2]MDF9856087.1 ACDE family multidrug resistance protein [Paenibacillus sp. PastF-1]MDH6481381.1 ACDE family multidrug resistance protein [Paenibacillus sp. PastH-2]MDH6508776.1 ACDE family multidrug resistance protein [Paenibacillus sp. PastM-3]
MKDKKWDLMALASIPLIMTLGNSMLLPVLPQISRELHISSFQVSLLITLYGLMAILMIPVAGYLSDRFGRKKIIMPSLIIAAAGGAVCIAAALFTKGITAYWIILGGRVLQGIGAAGAFPIVLPFVGDMFKDEKVVSKSLGLIETSNTFGKVLSPILGAYLGLLLWYAPFISIPVLCIISFLLVLFLVKEPEREADQQSLKDFMSGIVAILREHGRWLYAIFAIGGICMFVTFGVLFYLSETLEDKYNIHGVIKGLVLAIPLALLCLASYGSGKIIGQSKLRMKWIGCGGMFLITAGMIITGFGSGLYWLVGLLSVGGVGIGIALPCLDALITEGIDQQNRGTITSLYSSMRFIGVALGPPVISLLMPRGQWLLFGTMAGVSAIGGLLTLLAVTPGKSSGSGQRGEKQIQLPRVIRQRAR